MMTEDSISRTKKLTSLNYMYEIKTTHVHYVVHLFHLHTELSFGGGSYSVALRKRETHTDLSDFEWNVGY